MIQSRRSNFEETNINIYNKIIDYTTFQNVENWLAGQGWSQISDQASDGFDSKETRGIRRERAQ
jgi:hypothetical protein